LGVNGYKTHFKERERQPKVNKLKDKVSFSDVYNSKKFKFVISPGNNSKLIREAFRQRSWWIEIPNFITSLYNFKWQPTSVGIKFRHFDKTMNDGR
jgi:hypothetical protein